MQVKSIMTRDPVVVPPTMTVEAVAQMLAQRHISAAFVVDAAGLPIGVVSEGDLIRRLAPSAEETGLGWLARQLIDRDRAATQYVRTHGRQVRDIMSADVAAVEEGASVRDATEMMQKRKVRRLAVVRGGRIVGVVSRADLLKAIIAEPDRLAGPGPDQRIQQAILGEMQRHPWGTPHLTGVVVENGIVRLEGYCRSEQARQALRVAAERVEGVRGVEDRLEISPLHDYALYPQI